MKLIKCPKCGNKDKFYEKVQVIERNEFRQDKSGRVNKVNTEYEQSLCCDSRIYCSLCDQEIDDVYHLFLDRYSATLSNANV